jgi:GDP-L-fucose synthase
MSFDFSGKRVWVAGHTGMVGSAIMRRLQSESCDLLTVGHDQLDLCRQTDVETWMAQNKPDAIIIAAARVGGIHANSTYPVDFLYNNLAMEMNIIHGANSIGAEKLLFLGSSCIYPREAPQPMQEDSLLTGPLEPTNEWYAIAKIAGIKLCQAYRQQFDRDFISVMPTNLFGVGDNFHPSNSHVPAALLRRFHEAKLAGDGAVSVWGSGTPRREFLWADDLADACIFLMKNYSGVSHVNIGQGTDVTIREFSEMIADVVDYKGKLEFDTTRPDGAPQKLLDVSRLTALGWTAPTSIKDGLGKYYAWYLENEHVLRER